MHFQDQIKSKILEDSQFFYPPKSKMQYEGKIIYPCIMAKESCFVYEEQGFFAPAPANIITGKENDMKYLVGLLNSRLIYFMMRKFYMGGGIEGELKTNNLLKIFIPKRDSQNPKLTNQIIALVDQILQSKEIDPKNDTSTLESQIDSLVYELYNLSEEEIGMVEGSKKLN